MNEIEPLIKSALPVMIRSTIDALSDLGGGSIAGIKRILNSDVKRYLESELQRVMHVKTILHRSAPVYLYKVYEPLFVAGSPAKLRYSSGDLAAQFTNVEGKKYTILGEAGSGKSTFLRDLFFWTAKISGKIPVIIELRTWNNGSFTMEELLDAIVGRVTPSDSEITMGLLKKGRLVIFLDGFDEVPAAKHTDLVKGIGKFCRLYPANDLIMTSRPFSAVEMLPEFINLFVCRLDEVQRESFVRRQVADRELAEKISKSLVASHADAYAQEYAGNPLLLSLFILTYQTYARVPAKRHIFYGRVIDALFSEHDSLSKLGFEREWTSGLEKEQIESILMRFSLLTFFNDEVALSVQQIYDHFDLIKQRLPYPFENRALLHDLRVAIGIFSEENGHIAFVHRSIQEYFVALLFQKVGEWNKGELYRKLFEYVSSRDYSHSANLLILLKEMNLYDFLKLFALPLVEEAIGFLLVDNETERVSKCEQVVASIQARYEESGPMSRIFSSGIKYYLLMAADDLLVGGSCDPLALVALMFDFASERGDLVLPGVSDGSSCIDWKSLLNGDGQREREIREQVDQWFEDVRISLETARRDILLQLEYEKKEQGSVLDLLKENLSP